MLKLTLGSVAGLLLILLAGPAAMALSGRIDLSTRWSQASREVVGIAPPAATTPEAIVQVYAARTFNWRGAFAIHTWIAVKPEGADSYTVHEVIGWRTMRGGSALATAERAPDRQWYGQDPKILTDIRGAEAAALIPQIEAAVESYPWPDRYEAWPGPNSNTFIAHIGREVPGLRLDLPSTAVGKDYLGPWKIFARSPSGTGYQLSFRGYLGLTVGLEDGLKLTVLGLTLGIDPLDLAVDLPGVGRVGLLT